MADERARYVLSAPLGWEVAKRTDAEGSPRVVLAIFHSTGDSWYPIPPADAVEIGKALIEGGSGLVVATALPPAETNGKGP